MDGDNLTKLAVFLSLIVLHALITLAYAALVNTRQTHLREQADAGNRSAQRILDLTEGSNRLHITYQLSIMVLRFFTAAWIAVNVVEPLANGNPLILPVIDYGVILVVMACLIFILGDLVPEAVGSAHATALAFWAVYPMRWLVRLLSPVVGGMLAISRALSSLFRSSEKLNTVTEEEIMTLVDAGHTGGTIEEEEKEMISAVLQLDQTFAREVMIPRIDVKAVGIDTTMDEARAVFIDSGYSRIPVYDGTIDNIKGLLYAKDLLSLWGCEAQQTLNELIRPAYFVPENKRADDLLRDMKSRKVHIAVVVDEYGGTAGLVTIEDLIEEIIGDIQDEYDVDEEADYVENSPGDYTVDASMNLDDFNDLLDVELPTEDSDTLGGFIYAHLGRVPQVGETIARDSLVLKVESIEGRRIRKVHVTRQTPTVPKAAVEPETAPQTTEEISNQGG